MAGAVSKVLAEAFPFDVAAHSIVNLEAFDRSACGNGFSDETNASIPRVADNGEIAMGRELNVSFIRPISSGHVNALCRVRRKGRTAWNWEVEITDDDGRLCAISRVTVAVRPGP